MSEQALFRILLHVVTIAFTNGLDAGWVSNTEPRVRSNCSGAITNRTCLDAGSHSEPSLNTNGLSRTSADGPKISATISTISVNSTNGQQDTSGVDDNVSTENSKYVGIFFGLLAAVLLFFWLCWWIGKVWGNDGGCDDGGGDDGFEMREYRKKDVACHFGDSDEKELPLTPWYFQPPKQGEDNEEDREQRAWGFRNPKVDERDIADEKPGLSQDKQSDTTLRSGKENHGPGLDVGTDHDMMMDAGSGLDGRSNHGTVMGFHAGSDSDRENSKAETACTACVAATSNTNSVRKSRASFKADLSLANNVGDGAKYESDWDTDSPLSDYGDNNVSRPWTPAPSYRTFDLCEPGRSSTERR